MALSIVYLIFSFLILTETCFTNKELEITASMLQHLKMEEYILVARVWGTICNLKFLTTTNILGIFLNFENLILYLQNIKILHKKTMIVIKVEDETEWFQTTEELDKKFSDERVFTMFTWMMFLPRNHSKLTKNNFHVPFNSQFFIVDVPEIKEIYQIRKNSEMIYSHFGTYTNEGLLSNVSYFYGNKMNMQGETLVMRISDQGKCLRPPECLHLEIFEDMGKILNFKTYLAKESEIASNFDKLLPDAHNRIAMLHNLLQNEEKILGPLTINIAHLYIREIDEDVKQWDSYLRPFHIDFWMALLFTVLATSLIISASVLAAKTVLSLKGFTLYDLALTPFSAFCNQACEYLPSISSIRIARISAYIASTVLVPAYSASIISHLTIHIPKIPFTDLESFVRDGSYKLAALGNPLFTSYFTNNSDPLIKTIIQNQLVPVEKFPTSHSEAIKLICNEEAVVVLSYNYRMIQLPAPCTIIQVSDIIFHHLGGIELLNEGLRYRELFQEILVRFHSAGILQKMKKINLGTTNFEKPYEFLAISILEVKSVVVFYALSILIAITLFICERIYYYVKSKNFRMK